MISILLQPQEFVPVYNETILVLDSTKKNEPKFQFVVDVNINGTFSSRIKIQPNLDGYGVVNLGRHIESYVSYNIDHTQTNIFQLMGESFTKYDVTLSEEYIIENTFTSISDNGGFSQYNYPSAHNYVVGDYITVSNATSSPVNNGNQLITSIPSSTAIVTNIAFNVTTSGTSVLSNGSTTIVTGSTVMSGDTFAVNAVLPWLDVPNWDYTDYQLRTGTTGSFLSSIPNINTVKLDDRIWSNIYHDATGPSTYMIVISDNGTFRILNTLLTTNDARQFLTVGVGPWNIKNTTNPILVLSGSLPIIDSGTTQYTVQIVDASLNPTSELLTFNIDNTCSKFENFRMIYMDRFGSFLNINFDLANTKKINSRKTTYKQNYGSYDSVTNTYGWNSFDRGISRLDTDITEEYTITTNWVDEQIGTQVIDLINSPEVYHLNESGQLRAVNIDTSSLIEKQKITDKLFNYTIKFKYATKNSVQRG